MGLLDWLTEGAGSNTGGASPPLGMPPMQSMDLPNPINQQPPMPQVGDGGPSPMSPPPSSPPPPMPPAASDGSDGDVLPPNAAPTGGVGLVPPNSMPPNPGEPTPALLPGQTPIGRALGLNPNSNSFKEGVSGLGAGLTAAGNSRGKSKFQALASGAGATIEGSDKRADKTTDQQSKYLTQAITAAQRGDTAALNVARTRLALAQAKTEEAKAGKPESATGINTPDAKYLTAVARTNSDPRLALLRDQVRSGSAGSDAKAQTAQMEEMRTKILNEHMATLGLSAKDAAKISKQPGFAADNPVPAAGLDQKKFDQLPVGAYFINPKDNRLLIKQPPAGANPAAPAQSPAPAAPAPVTAPAGSAADQENEE